MEFPSLVLSYGREEFKYIISVDNSLKHCLSNESPSTFKGWPLSFYNSGLVHFLKISKVTLT